MSLGIIDALKWGAQQLEDQHIENARTDADRLLAKVLGFRRDLLYLERTRELSPEVWENYKRLIAKRAEHEPLQYLLGEQEFMGLGFVVDPRVLIPRPETELIVETLLELRKMDSSLKGEPRIVDLCTGSGALAIAIKYYWPEAHVTGTDLSQDALEVAQVNAVKNGVEIDWRQGDFLEPIRRERWNFIVTNPPYVSEADYQMLQQQIYREPRIAFVGGSDGLRFYRQLAEQGRAHLEPDGKILMEIGWNQGKEVQDLFQTVGFEVSVLQDLAGRDRLVIAR